VETEPSFVRAEGGVELHAVTALDMRLSMIVLPDDTELDDALWDLAIGQIIIAINRRMNTHLDDIKCAFVFGVFREERSD
jgi:hypothetical protein